MSFVTLDDLPSDGPIRANGGEVDLLDDGRCVFRPGDSLKNALRKTLKAIPSSVVARVSCLPSPPFLATVGGFFRGGRYCAPVLPPPWNDAWTLAQRLEGAAMDRARRGVAALNRSLGVGTARQPAWWLSTRAKTTDFYAGGPPGDPYALVELGVDVGRLPGGYEGIFSLPNRTPDGVSVTISGPGLTGGWGSDE